ncbi:hypothetical protein B0H15DRAFT_991240 [Mycena belliarum]|uniref:Uncharacterized protein n=1 Tax=Mycena belliarum TaxID=1033014 RepID=A0AAD6UF81_9AGAR|nr:hypothetical protein B0H15DRAFT_991240 [Mycena belliae]
MPKRLPSAPSAHARRNPHKKLQPVRKRVGISSAAKASMLLKRAQNKARLEAYDDDVDRFFAYRSSEISHMSTEHSVKEADVRKLLCNVSHYKHSRRPTLHNAILHDMALKAQEAGDAKAVPQLQEDLTEAVEAGTLVVDEDLLDDEEKKRLMDQLIEFRSTQARGARSTNKSAAMDGVQTVKRIGDELVDLFERTGIRGFAVLSRGNADDAALPVCVESDDILDFFMQTYDFSWGDMLRAFEMYCCTRDKGNKSSNDLSKVRKEIVTLMGQGLRKVSKDKGANMSYDDYDYQIRELKRVELLGWPTDITMERPSKMGVESARKIRDRLRDGSIQWHRMTAPDHAALVKKHEHERAEHLARTGEPLRRRAERSDSGKKRGPNKGKGKGKSGAKGKGAAGKGGDESADDSSSGSGSEDEDSGDKDRTPTASSRAGPRTGASAASVALPSAPPSSLVPASTAPIYRHYAPFNPEAFDPSSFDFTGLVAMPGLGLSNENGAPYPMGHTEVPGSLDAYGVPLQLRADAHAGVTSNTDVALHADAHAGATSNVEVPRSLDAYGAPPQLHADAHAGATSNVEVPRSLDAYGAPLQLRADAHAGVTSNTDVEVPRSLDAYGAPLQLRADAHAGVTSNTDAAVSLDAYGAPFQLNADAHAGATSNVDGALSLDRYGAPFQLHGDALVGVASNVSGALSLDHYDYGAPFQLHADAHAGATTNTDGDVAAPGDYGGLLPTDYASSTYAGIEGMDRAASGAPRSPSEATGTAMTSMAADASRAAGRSTALAPTASQQPPKKRKGQDLEGTGGAKRARKATGGDSSADSTEQRKEQKERSDKGKRKKDRGEEEENEPAPRKRKVRSDAGKPRKKRNA